MSLKLVTKDHYRNFIETMKNAATKKMYVFYFNKYREFVKEENIIREDTKLIETQVIDYLVYLKSKNLSHETITSNLSAIMRFYTMNDIILNRRKIVKFINTDQKKRRILDILANKFIKY